MTYFCQILLQVLHVQLTHSTLFPQLLKSE